MQRYKAVSAELDRYARDNMAVGGKLLTRMNGIAPSLLLALGARACIRQRADLAFVNAPGPPAPITTFGRPMVDAWALAPHPPGVRWSATARSYVDSVSVSLTGTAVAGVQQALAGMQRELEELLGAPTAKPRRAPRRHPLEPARSAVPARIERPWSGAGNSQTWGKPRADVRGYGPRAARPPPRSRRGWSHPRPCVAVTPPSPRS